jgi:hypothetical protein
MFTDHVSKSARRPRSIFRASGIYGVLFLALQLFGKKNLKSFPLSFVYILNRTFMETNAIIIEDQIPAAPALDYTTRLAILFVDICDFIGLPVNIPWGLQSQNDEAIF